MIRTVPIAALALALATPAAADFPSAETMAADLGLSAAEISKVRGGQIVDLAIAASTERDITAGFAFVVKAPPSQLLADVKQSLLDQVDENMIGAGTIEGSPTVASFAKLTLEPDAARRAAAYVSARPGGELNLSPAEIEAFGKLGGGAKPPLVQKSVREKLLDRLSAYRSKGLAGIAPYARGGGELYSPADDLRAMTKAATKLDGYAPRAYRTLLEYPAFRAPGTEERFRWTHFLGNNVPTIALTHRLFIPEGEAWLVIQRQYFVSTGYNVQQAISAFYPVKSGTLVFYTSRVSTDQVTGFGGSAKRSLGSKITARQLRSLFEQARAREARGG